MAEVKVARFFSAFDVVSVEADRNIGHVPELLNAQHHVSFTRRIDELIQSIQTVNGILLDGIRRFDMPEGDIHLHLDFLLQELKL